MFTRGVCVARGRSPWATYTARVNITECSPLLSVNKYFVTSRANCMIMKICAFGHSTNPLHMRLTYVCIQENHFHKSRTILILAKILQSIKEILSCKNNSFKTFTLIPKQFVKELEYSGQRVKSPTQWLIVITNLSSQF